MGSPRLTMGLTPTVLFAALLPVSLLALSVQPPRTVFSTYYPQYLPLYRPVSFQPRLVCSACSCSGDFWCASYCPKCATDSYCEDCSCTTSLACRDKCQRCKAQSEKQQAFTSSGNTEKQQAFTSSCPICHQTHTHICQLRI